MVGNVTQFYDKSQNNIEMSEIVISLNRITKKRAIDNFVSFCTPFGFLVRLGPNRKSIYCRREHTVEVRIFSQMTLAAVSMHCCSCAVQERQ